MGDPADLSEHHFNCPGCDEAVAVSAEAVGQLVRCPYCNTEFFAAEGRTHEVIVDDTDPVVEIERSPDELDSLRMRQLSAERIATLRTRSWWSIGVLLGVVTAIDLLGKAGRYAWTFHRWGIRPTLLTTGGLVAAVLAGLAWRMSRKLAREAAKSSLGDPVTPPDFTPLDDGSNRWRHLEQL